MGFETELQIIREPQIYDVPIVTKEPETPRPGSEEDVTYNDTTYTSHGIGTTGGADDSSEDFRDFVYPEGWSLHP